MSHEWKEDSIICQTHRSMYPSIFNRFPVIQPVISKVGHFNFSTCFVHFVLPWVRPWDNRGRCYMDGKRIQCWSNALQRIPIYLQPFTSYGEIDICRKLQLFLPLAFNATVGVFPLEFRKKVWTSENYGATRQWRQFDDKLSHFDTLPACDGQTDGQTSSL